MLNYKNFQHLSRARSAGFSMYELLVILAILGIVLAIIDFGGIGRLTTSLYSKTQEASSKKIAAVLLQHARTNNNGTLPSPYSGSGYSNTVYDPSNGTLAQLFRSANLAPAEINDDGSAAQNVRVYQMVNVTTAMPLDFQSGPSVTLTYQYGELHQTTCPLAGTSCNHSPLPGASTVMSTSNYKTWAPTRPDIAFETFSTLPMQKQMLALTNQRLLDIRDKITNVVLTQQKNAASNDNSNWYPYPYAAGVPGTPNPDLSGAPAASTALGCWDGWYDLSAANVNVLAQLGLSQMWGKTQWGGRIEYCRDYDPALRGANSLPHYAAIRINQSVSLGIAPTTVLADDIFITF